MALLENKNIILASNSPRRRELLLMLGIKFNVVSPLCDETLDDNFTLTNAIIDVSKRKALSIESPNSIIISADTLVAIDGRVLGKPADEPDAFDMLSALSGNTHEVLTAVTIKNGDELTSFCVSTEVVFNVLSDEEIYAYIATGEPMDKAGAYGIQGLGGVFVKEIHGDYFSVVGLPVSALYQHLKDI